MVDTYTTVIPFVLAISTALGTLISLCFYNIRRSRCGDVDCCGLKCSRSIMTLEELQADQKNNSKFSGSSV